MSVNKFESFRDSNEHNFLNQFTEIPLRQTTIGDLVSVNFKGLNDENRSILLLINNLTVVPPRIKVPNYAFINLSEQGEIDISSPDSLANIRLFPARNRLAFDYGDYSYEYGINKATGFRLQNNASLINEQNKFVRAKLDEYDWYLLAGICTVGILALNFSEHVIFSEPNQISAIIGSGGLGAAGLVCFRKGFKRGQDAISARNNIIRKVGVINQNFLDLF